LSGQVAFNKQVTIAPVLHEMIQVSNKMHEKHIHTYIVKSS